MAFFSGPPESHHGRDVDDVAAALLLHDAGDFLGEYPDASDIDIEKLVPFIQRKIQGRRAPGGAGIIDQNIDPPEFL